MTDLRAVHKAFKDTGGSGRANTDALLDTIVEYLLKDTTQDKIREKQKER